jgi:ABC-type oligopeptide transport system substrate-binding subunit
VRRRTWLSVIALAAGVGLLATAAALASPAQKRGGTLRLNFLFELDSLDPAIGYEAVGWMLEYATCAKLYNNPDKSAPEGTVTIPEVATGLPKVSPDGKTQTIRLRQTFRFDNGQPVAAANFVAAFNRDANPKLHSPASSYFHEIVGADAVMEGKAQTISGVKALGAYTIRIRTTRPLPDLAARLTMPFFCPIAVNTPAVEIDDPLGSGPYYFASHVPNRQIVLERNRFYRGSRPANVDRIVVTFGLGQAACLQAVEQDQMDWCITYPPPAYRGLASTYGINRSSGRFFFTPILGLEAFAFNHDRAAFKGPGQIPLAKAINWAIDRHALAAAAGYLGGKRTDQILPPALGRDTSIYPLGGVTDRSLATARALLAKARFKPKSLVLYAFSAGGSGVDKVWAQIFQFDMKRLGIDVQIQYMSLNEFFNRTGTRGEPFDVAITPWIADFADGAAFFRPLLYGPNIAKSGNSNVAYFDVPKYNREIDAADSLEGTARRRAWTDLDAEMMRDDPPYAPFMLITFRDFISKSYGCFIVQPALGRPDLAAACKK